MADIQAALPAKFLQVANAGKGIVKPGLPVEIQLASFFGVLKSQLTGQDMPAASLVTGAPAGHAKKPVLPLLEAEAAQPAAVLPAAVNDQPVTTSQVDGAPLQAAVVAALNVKAEGLAPQDASTSDLDPDAELGLPTETIANKSVASDKPGGKATSSGVAIAAAAGQALPPGKAAVKEDVTLPGSGPSIAEVADVAVKDAQLSAPLQSLPGGRVDAGVSATGATPITVVHPFEQVLRQAESRINAAIEAPVRSPAFAAELGEKVVWLATRQGQFADLSLNPPQMGALEVRLTLSGSDASAQFYSPNPAVREAIDAALPRLRELMSQAGINLGETGVREQAFGHREQPEQRGQVNSHEDEMSMQSVAMTDVARSRTAGLGLVDLYI